tara:strand:- start:1924 stop:2853 length:930 start_codon:yes stop_codon:yes gene_type:complete
MVMNTALPRPIVQHKPKWAKVVATDTLDRYDHLLPFQDPRENHQKLGHGLVTRRFFDELDRQQVEYSEPISYVSTDDLRSRMITQLTIRHRDIVSDSNFVWQAFLRNSHDQSMALGAGLGQFELVCANGMQVLVEISGSKTKHTRNVGNRWENTISASVSGLKTYAKRMNSTIESCKDVELDPNSKVHRRKVDHVIMESARRGIINNAGTIAVDKHWREPEHKEFRDDRSVWRLMQAFTSHDRNKNLMNQHVRSTKMFDLFSESFGTQALEINRNGSLKKAMDLSSRYGGGLERVDDHAVTVYDDPDHF